MNGGNGESALALSKRRYSTGENNRQQFTLFTGINVIFGK